MFVIKHDEATRIKSPAPENRQSALKPEPNSIMEWSAEEALTYFASSGTIGVVDLGASQTIIGSHQVIEFLQREIRERMTKTKCHIIFRFGNHQTLISHVAINLSVHQIWFRIAIVPGQTAFLFSNAFLKTIQAVIDADEGSL